MANCPTAKNPATTLLASKHQKLTLPVEDNPTPRSPEGLVRGGGDHIAVGEGRGGLPCCYQAANVGHVC